MNTESPHLDLEDLLAGVDGQAEGGPARAHLNACPRCHAEAERWQSVAAGVRHLVATAPPPPEAFSVTGARRRPRLALAAAAAAGILVLGGTAYGLTAGLGGPGHQVGRGGLAAGLIAVRGCAGVAQVSGTLERVRGTSLVIDTPSGQVVTVTASASTLVELLTAPLGDVTDGTHVIVIGTSSDGTIAAGRVVTGRVSAAPGTVAVQGTVADASGGGFTVVTADGTRVPVTTSSDTQVIVHNASLSRLQVGKRAAAAGRGGPDGTLAAFGIVQGGFIRTGPVSAHGCSPSAVDMALAADLVPAG